MKGDLGMLVGNWRDLNKGHRAKQYDVVASREHSLTVISTLPGGEKRVARDVIQTQRNGWITWGAKQSYYLDSKALRNVNKAVWFDSKSNKTSFEWEKVRSTRH